MFSKLYPIQCYLLVGTLTYLVLALDDLNRDALGSFNRHISDQHTQVLFVGEHSNHRSLPIALALLRGAVDGIWATYYEQSGVKDKDMVPIGEAGMNDLIKGLRSRTWRCTCFTPAYVSLF